MNKNAASATARAAGEKAKKQKKILAVTSVIFLALLGFQLPKLMHSGGGGGEAAAPPADTSITPATPIAAPSASSLPDTDRVTLTPGSGQLVSFGLFKSKDPFVQQLGTTPAEGVTPAPDVTTPQTLPSVTDPTVTTQPVTTQPVTPQPVTTPRRTAPNGGLTPVTTTTPTTTSGAPAIPGVNVPTTPSSPSTTPVSTTPVSLTPGTTTTTATKPKPAPAPTSASISTNGLCQVVAVNGTFPSQDDIFRVVSIAKDGKSVKIGIVGGAYDSGAPAITLDLGKKLTLVNTADGSRYVLILKAKCDTQTTPVTGGATTTPTTPTSTVAPPATTSTATTPIVTDALDTTTPTP